MRHTWSNQKNPLSVICKDCGQPLVPNADALPGRDQPRLRSLAISECRIREDCPGPGPSITLETVEEPTLKTFDVFLRIQTDPRHVSQSVLKHLEEIINEAHELTLVAAQARHMMPEVPAEEEKKQ